MQLFKKNVTTACQKEVLVLTEKTILNHCMYFIIAIMHNYMQSMYVVIMHIIALQLVFFKQNLIKIIMGKYTEQ